MTNPIGFKCNACGSTDFEFAHSPPQDDDVMTCAGCKREFGKLSDIKILVKENIEAASAKLAAGQTKPELDS